MQKNKIVRFMNSFVALPLFLTTTLPMTSPATKSSVLSFIPQSHIIVKQSPEDIARQEHADKIDAYFTSINSPLAGYGMKFVQEAEKNDIEWNLVAGIAMRESTGGIHGCKSVDNNPFGWASCKIGFDSIEHAIEVVSKNLGGNNPRTAYHYDSKTTRGILQAYNPPTIVKHYADQVMGIMDDIANS
jgi:Mannosyl-glycoprotein endo-beta-N-acetylglucosaminidase